MKLWEFLIQFLFSYMILLSPASTFFFLYSLLSFISYAGVSSLFSSGLLFIFSHWVGFCFDFLSGAGVGFPQLP